MLETINQEKVVFYFPWREVSGGPYYFTRLANQLAQDPAYDVYYADYHNSLSESMLLDNIKRIYVTQHDYNLRLPDIYTLVMPIYWARWIRPMHPQCKILFANWHNECIPALKNIWQIDNSQADVFLNLVHRTQSVFFCDYSHWMAQNRPNIVFEKKFVPIVVPAKNRAAKTTLTIEGQMSLGILSRLSEDKVWSVINLLDNFQNIKTPLKKALYIVGDGPEKKLIKPEKYKDIDIVFKGVMTGDTLDEFLSSSVDVLFAMGTAALDGAALKLPTVIMPHGMDPIYCDRYVYLQNTVGYCLGWYEDQIDELGLKTMPLVQVINAVHGGHKTALGQAAYKYYKANHTIEVSVAHLKKALQETTLNYNSFHKVAEGLFRYYKFMLTIHPVELHKSENGRIRIKMFGCTVAYAQEDRVLDETTVHIGKVAVLKIIKKSGKIKLKPAFGLSKAASENR